MAKRQDTPKMGNQVEDNAKEDELRERLDEVQSGYDSIGYAADYQRLQIPIRAKGMEK